MADVNVIDRFTQVYANYIDSGFGLLGGEVAFVATTLIVIDVTLAALFWTLAPGEDIIARLIKKTLFVGFFAFLIGNFNRLAQIVFNSFAGLGLTASGSTISRAEFLQPGHLAQVGVDVGKPLLEAASELMGFVGFFENFIQIFVLLAAFVVVVVAFFVMAVQLFVTLIEFKLTTLAGFVLVPFGLFGKTAFLAERVLGNVMASGVKVLVLAVIVGIGTTLFGELSQDFSSQPTLEEVLGLMLAALTLFGLSIFGPAIATGLTAGAPQLGAGAAVGTGLAAGGLAMVGGAAVAGGAGLGLATVRGGAQLAAATGSAYRTGSAASGQSGLRAAPAGVAGVAQAGVSQMAASVRRALGLPAASPPASAAPSAQPPAWARDLKRSQHLGHGAAATAHAVRSGDHGGGSTTVPLKED